MEPTQQQDEQLSSTVSGNGNGNGSNGNGNGNNNGNKGGGATAANGSLGPMSNYDCDRDKQDLIPTTLWNSVTGKLSHKTGSSSVTTPDGNFNFFLNINKYL